MRSIYDLHVDAVYRIAAEFTEDKRLGREKTQDVFVRAFASIAEYRGGESLEEWLIAIALDELRGSGCADLAYGRHYVRPNGFYTTTPNVNPCLSIARHV
jgi:hypothetical protein